MEKIKNNKKLMTALVVLAVIIVAIVLMLFTVEMRVVGVWQRETLYLEKYGCDSVMILTLNDDGSFYNALYEEDTGELLHSDSGRWKVEGFEVVCRRPDQDGSTPYDFNPITGTMNNNVNYRKID